MPRPSHRGPTSTERRTCSPLCGCSPVFGCWCDRSGGGHEAPTGRHPPVCETGDSRAVKTAPAGGLPRAMTSTRPCGISPKGCAALGNEAGAVTTLAETLTLAHPHGYVRVFVDEGPAMGTLLGRL